MQIYSRHKFEQPNAAYKSAGIPKNTEINHNRLPYHPGLDKF